MNFNLKYVKINYVKINYVNIRYVNMKITTNRQLVAKVS